MSIKSRAVRFLRYVASVRNSRLFLYRTYHYLNRDMPAERANKICLKNRTDYRKDKAGDIIIDTYDGSGQLVHPDMIRYGSDLWFVATPYPYGMEEYENPCIYRCTSDGVFAPHTCPLSYQDCHKQGTHLSDPVFLALESELYCIYRSTERREVNHLLRSRYDSATDKWGRPELFYSSKDDFLLSPAFVFDGSIIMFHADWNGDCGRLIRSVLKRDYSFESSQKVLVNGLPKGFGIWHLAVRKSSDDSTADNLKALFLLKEIRNAGLFRLFNAVSHDKGFTWDVTDEVVWPDSLARIIKYPHKSCFIPGSDGIILCYVDKSDRYRLLRLE